MLKKKSVEKIEEISLFNNDRTRIVERTDKKEEREIKDFEDFEECFLANKWTMKTDTTKLEER